MNLKQALRFSELSTVKVDGCTFSPEFGISRYCRMHDHVLIHLVNKTHNMNTIQLEFIANENIKDITRLIADNLFKQGLQEKVESKSGIKKIGYLFVKWIYYSAVRLRSITGIGKQ
ncbi:MAG: hypothetical protein OEY29_14435 [Gammaproteobacteria bacterium]|nr:hypothetical protein [Gammaproteobacteria bacterium]